MGLQLGAGGIDVVHRVGHMAEVARATVVLDLALFVRGIDLETLTPKGADRVPKVIHRPAARTGLEGLEPCKVTLGPEQASVTYQTPYNGKYGTFTLSKTDGNWSIQDHQQMHSSSGARYFYGELYEGVACRDGSEMAKRWNMYKDAVEAAMARRARTPEDALPSTCPGKEFPDVASYKQFKAMRLNK